jgi:hypothetical protein
MSPELLTMYVVARKGLGGLMSGIRPSRLHWLILGLTILHIIPIWAFDYFPSQDGPSHIDNAYMLLHYSDHATEYSDYYDLNLRPFPNWFSHAALAGLMVFASPLVAEKTFLTISFVYSYLLHKGFYNFSFSIPLMFLTIGYWYRRRDRRMDWRLLVGLNLLLTFLYFCSILSQLLAMMGIMVLALLHHRVRLHRTLLVAMGLVPSCLLPLYYLQTQPFQYTRRLPLGYLWSYFGTIGSITSYDFRQQYVGGALCVLYAILVVYTLVRQTAGRRGRRLGPGVADGGGFWLLAVMFCVLYFFMPAGMYGGGGITHRLNLFPFIMILPCLTLRIRQPVKWALGAAAIALILIHLGINTHYYRVLNVGLDEYNSGMQFVNRNETILPVSFSHKGAESARVRVFLHAGSYYCAQRGAINLANYESDKSYFPLRYKTGKNPFAIIGRLQKPFGFAHPERYPEPIDHILLWSPRDHFHSLAWIEENYELVHSRGRLRLYTRREGL